MKRAEITEKIEYLFSLDNKNRQWIMDQLTDLFIELSNERCQEQREYCERSFINDGYDANSDTAYRILNAPLPEIN